MENLRMTYNYLNLVDKILEKINQNKINSFEINNNDFYLKVKINNKNLKENQDKSYTKSYIEIILKYIDYKKDKNNQNNSKSSEINLSNLKERIEDGYKIIFYEENNEKYVDIVSTLVGRFNLANNKDVKITKGSIVKANTILGYIEILNIYYYMKLDFDVKVEEIYAENLPFVQYSSKLLKLKVID
jgi:biotin carboxyl carrier protein